MVTCLSSRGIGLLVLLVLVRALDLPATVVAGEVGVFVIDVGRDDAPLIVVGAFVGAGRVCGESLRTARAGGAEHTVVGGEVVERVAPRPCVGWELTVGVAFRECHDYSASGSGGRRIPVST